MPSKKTTDNSIFDLTDRIEALLHSDKVLIADSDGNVLGSAKNQPANIIREIHGHVSDIISSYLSDINNIKDLRVKMEILLNDFNRIVVFIEDGKISSVAIDPTEEASLLN